MLKEIYTFELKYHLKLPLFYIIFAIFFLLTFGAVTSDAVQIGGSLGNVNRNAPFVIMQFLLIMSAFGVLTTTAFVANAVHRDVEYNTDSLFFSSPLRKLQYLGGRFLGSFTIASLVYLGVVTAIMIGSRMPWLEKERIGPFLLKPYVFAFFFMVVPNLLLAGAIFFAVAALTRSMMATYASVVAFYVGYAIAGTFLGNLENERLTSLVDPFGFGAFRLATRYWTVFERNTNVIPLQGIYLWNRILWLAIAAAILAFAVWKFDFTVGARKSERKKKAIDDEAPFPHTTLALPSVGRKFGGSASLGQYAHAARVETISVIKSIPFIIIVFLGILNLIGSGANIDQLFGTYVYPVTNRMLQAIEGSFLLFTIIVLTFYAGDIVWRERSLKLNEVTDAMPMPTWAIWGGKLTALIVVTFVTLTTAVITAMSIQIFKGYHNFELLLYVRGVFLEIGSVMLLIAALAFFVQVITNNKYVGFLVMTLYFISLAVLPALHLDHHLYSIATTPNIEYSDMNGFGHFVTPALWFTLYWTLFVAALLVVAHLLWIRGTETRVRERWTLAKERFGRAAATTLAALLLGFVASGCFIYYNTNLLNRYRTVDDNDKRSADFERKFKKYERIPQPRITDVEADVDIFPESRAVQIRGRYKLVNKTAAPIRDLHVTMNPDVTSHRVVIPGARILSDDKRLGYAIYRLDTPLAPGATLPMTFTVSMEHRGFANESRDNEIVENGTFINNLGYFPHLGYQRFGELQDRNKRKKHGLAPIQRMAKIDDPVARMNNEVSRESDWLNLDTTVSTSADQIAIAPGYLQKEWTAKGRRFFHYKTTSRILGFWSYLSARYEVKRDRWNDIPIEIYYDRKHPYNVDRMIYAVKKSLDYFTQNFSIYQHRQVRIIEFPRYARFAQSFPNTIPFSESIGFIADLRDKERIDYVFYVTAHEVGHQWWAHQVIGADVQGATMITETMAQYSALMVMEKEYGPQQMRKFLKYELNRYLSGRGGELVAEMPLMLVEGQQYIHYSKGSLAMYALRDQIGEDRVNAVLRNVIRDHAFSGPPYVTAAQVVEEFRRVTPPEKQSIIHDLFETITLYDNRATEVSSTRLPNGTYRVKFTVESKKLRSTGGGAESAAPIDDWIDIAVLGDSGKSKTHDDKVLFLDKRHIMQPVNTFEVTVKEKPTKAGIDPFNKLIDRNPDDNTKKL